MVTVDEIPRVRRLCDLGNHCAPPHGWERLNPDTEEPFRRGRVAFWCAGHPPVVCAQCGVTVRRPGPTTRESGLCMPCLNGPPPSIGDTCCGRCPGGTCYVDMVTGA